MSNAPLAALPQDIDRLHCLGLNRAEKPVTSRTWAGEPDLRALADDCDLLVLAADQPGEIRAWANRACLAAGTPWIDAGYHGPTPHTAAFLPGRGACYECRLPGHGEARDLRLLCGQFRPDRPLRRAQRPAGRHKLTAGPQGA